MKKIMFFHLTIILLWTIGIFAPLTARAQDVDPELRQEGFQKAVSLYYNKEYSKAEKIFKRLLQDNGDNGYLHYNLGNVYFKQNRNGLALLHYEKARLHLPRFEDLKINRQMALNKSGTTPELSFSDYLLKTFYFWNVWLSRSEIQNMFLAISLLMWGGFIVKLIRRQTLFRFASLLMLIFYGYFGLGTWLKIDAELPNSFGIVLANKVEARASYLEKEQPLFYLNEGDKVRIIDRQDFGSENSWLKIALPQGQKGWVLSRNVGAI